MKRLSSIIFSFIGFCFMVGMIANSLQLGIIGTLVTFIALTILMVVTQKRNMPGVHVSGPLDQQIWITFIKENLFKNNQFLLRSIDDSTLVNYLTINLPQAGAKPTFTKNRVLGGAATNTVLRTDSNLSYNISEWTSEPFLIINAEKVQLSYDKMASVLKEMMQEARQVTAQDILQSWAPTGTGGNILRTTGIMGNDRASTPQSTAANASDQATGQRLTFGLYDLKRLRKYLNKKDVAAEGRCLLLSSEMLDQLMDDVVTTKYREAERDIVNMKEGALTRLMGFDIYERSSALIYDNAVTPVVKAAAAAGAATDNDCGLFWQEDEVRRALGDIHMFETPNSAVHYGDVYSTLIRCGGSKARTTEVGVGAIVQTAAN